MAGSRPTEAFITAPQYELSAQEFEPLLGTHGVWPRPCHGSNNREPTKLSDWKSGSSMQIRKMASCLEICGSFTAAPLGRVD